MIEHIATTPFGRRGLSAAMLAGQMAARKAATETRASVDKWRVFRAVCEAKAMLGVSDRALAVLGALLSFHPQQDLVGGERLVVFPSNAQLSLRAHGMTPSTLRRHLAALVESALVVRRDSPNGKRYARKGGDGEIETAYGFDLGPLLARAEEFERMAEQIRAERRAMKLLRERLTLLRRDVCKMIAYALEEAVPGDWLAIQDDYRTIMAALPRTAARETIEQVEARLGRLAETVRKCLETHLDSQDSSAKESQAGRHLQNSNTNSHELEPRFEKKQGTEAEPLLEIRSKPRTYPLGLVLRACPDIADYARDGIADWGGLVATANLARSALGVSPDAWDEACEAMGAADAAICVAAILQRAEHIQSPGGYLRSLTDKARAGQFSVGPLLMSLLRAAGRGDRAKTG